MGAGSAEGSCHEVKGVLAKLKGLKRWLRVKSCRELEFGFQHLHQLTLLSVTPAPGDPLPSLASAGTARMYIETMKQLFKERYT